MNKMKFTEEQVIEALKETKGLQALAAYKLGCNVSTIWRYSERFESVKEELKHQHESLLDMAEGKLYQAIQNGEAWAICFFLKTRGKKRHYSERLQITDGEGNPVQPVQIVVISQESHQLTQQILLGERTTIGNNGHEALEARNN